MISIVVPAFNEEDGIAELNRRIAAAAKEWGDDYELLLVDDGSRDRTLAICEELAQHDSRLKVISLSRNFGHQAAVSAGLLHATGDIVAVLDADLQDPPEELGPFFSKIREGFDVVYAIRTKRKENIFKRAAYFVYYRVLKNLASIDMPLDSGDFCVMSASVATAINELPERNRFIRGLRTWVGFRQIGLSYERQARQSGESKYTFRRLLKLALDGIINFSYRPLQFSMLLGLTVGFFSVMLAIWVVIQYLMNWTIAGFNPRQARGWTSIVFVLLFSSAIQLFCLGVLGEYIGRLFEETKRRPAFLVKKRINTTAPRSRGEQASG